MKFLAIAIKIALLLNHAAWMPNAVQESLPPRRDFVCATRLQLRHPERCPAHGPGARLIELARKGLYPPRPLPVAAIDPALNQLPFNYLKAGSGSTDIYLTAEGAATGSGAGSSIPGGFVYLSYANRSDHSGTTVYGTQQGYVRGGSVSQITPPPSPGLAFSRTPDRPFAWVIAGGSCTSETPGGLIARGGRCFTRHSVVQVYDVERVGDWDWYMIGPNQWMEQRLLAVVDPDPSPPAGVDADRWISVNLYEQTVAVYQDGELVFATVASTGQHGVWTQPGTFQVWAKLERDNMAGGVSTAEGGNYYFLEDVPWVLYFDQSRALHGTYWHGKFGTPSSRGCVNLAPRDASWIFNFAEEGTWVHVWDPSGNTPTDPVFYGPGGA